MHDIWERFSYDSMEAFRDGAKKWLRDRSELGRSLEYADWGKLYKEFKEEKEAK